MTARKEQSRKRKKKVLNVGGNSKNIPIPVYFDGWQHDLLDIDIRGLPDILCDAREMLTLPAAVYDAVYCSHNLEHYYRHDVKRVLEGFCHVLKDDGFADIRVPDMMQVMKIVMDNGLDIDDVLYHAPVGPILVRDVIYGFGVEIERSGNDYFAHRTGFSAKSLAHVLNECGFKGVYVECGNLEIRAIGFKQEPVNADRYSSANINEMLAAR